LKSNLKTPIVIIEFSGRMPSTKSSKSKTAKPTPKAKPIAKRQNSLKTQEPLKGWESETECHQLMEVSEKPKF
jgi:hypothetical protein